jgi:hypothetical protein
MSGSVFSLFDMAICVVPALSFGIWQLVSVNREIAKDKAKRARLPDDARHAVGEHGLDDR